VASLKGAACAKPAAVVVTLTEADLR